MSKVSDFENEEEECTCETRRATSADAAATAEIKDIIYAFYCLGNTQADVYISGAASDALLAYALKEVGFTEWNPLTFELAVDIFRTAAFSSGGVIHCDKEMGRHWAWCGTTNPPDDTEGVLLEWGLDVHQCQIFDELSSIGYQGLQGECDCGAPGTCEPCDLEDCFSREQTWDE